MGAYAYAITIDRKRQKVTDDEVFVIESNSLTLADFKRIGPDDCFSIHEIDWQDGGGYEVSITRSRLETDGERSARVEREEKYMEEYLKRQNPKEISK